MELKSRVVYYGKEPLSGYLVLAESFSRWPLGGFLCTYLVLGVYLLIMTNKEDDMDDAIREAIKRLGSMGGKARAKNLSKKRLSEIGRLGAQKKKEKAAKDKKK